MNRLLLLVLLLLHVLCNACVPAPDVPTYGQVVVGIDNCREPQLTYFRDNLSNLQALGGPNWILATPGMVPDVMVVCDAFGAERGAASYELGSGYVRVDPARANGEFAFSAAFEHELIHWRIYQGPRPANAVLHVCQHVGDSASCWTQEYGDAVMNPSLGQDMGWDGHVERIDTGSIAMNVCSYQDADFFRWAAHP